MRNTIDDILYSPITGSSSAVEDSYGIRQNSVAAELVTVFHRIYDDISYGLTRFRGLANDSFNRARVVRGVKAIVQPYFNRKDIYVCFVVCDETNNGASLSLIIIDVSVFTRTEHKDMKFFV